ncbi:MAG: glycosyltransferase family 2 protein [Candidatus Bathyarchaeia archaeon]
MSEKIIDTFTCNVGKAPVAVLMPVHNEDKIIEEVVTEFYSVIGSIMPLELVLSEDGSTDATRDVIEGLSRKIPLKAILSPHRKGYAGGIKDGLTLVESEYVLITDSDGQHDPKDFWKLWELRTKYDIVSGYREKRADPLYRRVMSKTFQMMVKHACGLPNFVDMTAPFKLMETKVAKEIAKECKYMSESFWNEFIARAYSKGLSIIEIPVNHRSRKDNSSTRVYKPWKIPKIVWAQLNALAKLRLEILNGKSIGNR